MRTSIESVFNQWQQEEDFLLLPEPVSLLVEPIITDSRSPLDALLAPVRGTTERRSTADKLHAHDEVEKVSCARVIAMHGSTGQLALVGAQS